jgi:hypothetical protein
MKKTTTTLFLTLATVLGFAQAQPISFEQPQSKVPVSATEVSKSVGTVYLKMGANETEVPKNADLLMPEVGVGYRYASGHHGIDVSVEGGANKVQAVKEIDQANYFVSLPKVDYLFYATPQASSSFYAGTGLALSMQRQNETETVEAATPGDAPTVTNTVREFAGISPNVLVGYEFGRKDVVKTFVELQVSQPAVAIQQQGNFPGPRASLFVGAGF